MMLMFFTYHLIFSCLSSAYIPGALMSRFPEPVFHCINLCCVSDQTSNSCVHKVNQMSVICIFHVRVQYLRKTTLERYRCHYTPAVGHHLVSTLVTCLTPRPLRQILASAGIGPSNEPQSLAPILKALDDTFYYRFNVNCQFLSDPDRCVTGHQLPT